MDFISQFKNLKVILWNASKMMTNLFLVMKLRVAENIMRYKWYLS